PPHALDQAAAVENGMDGAFRRNSDTARKPSHQKLPDLAGAPVGLFALEVDDLGLKLDRELIGVTYRTPGAVTESLGPALLVAAVNLVAGLPGNTVLAAQIRHRLAPHKAGHEAHTFVHHRTLLPRHPHLPPAKSGEKCYPCVRYEVSPMSQI